MSAIDHGRRAALARIGWGAVWALFGGVLAGSGSRRSHVGAREAEEGFRGIRIVATSRASLAGTSIEGVCRLEGAVGELSAGWKDAMSIVATDDARKEIFVSTATVRGGRFAANLAESLPFREARYDVYATLGPHRSNVVRVSVKDFSCRSRG